MLQDELAQALGFTKGYMSKLVTKGCPADDVGKARLWISQNIKARAKRKKAGQDAPTPAPVTIPPSEAPVSEDGDSWEARLSRAHKVERDIFQAAQTAIARKENSQLPSLLASYQRSLQGIAEAESAALSARIQSGELVHRDTARAIMVEMLQPIRSSLDLLPITERSRCNPQAPEVAEGALRAWKDSLLLRLSQADTKF